MGSRCMAASPQPRRQLLCIFSLLMWHGADGQGWAEGARSYLCVWQQRTDTHSPAFVQQWIGFGLWGPSVSTLGADWVAVQAAML